jgi:hypothetical protein
MRGRGVVTNIMVMVVMMRGSGRSSTIPPLAVLLLAQEAVQVQVQGGGHGWADVVGHPGSTRAVTCHMLQGTYSYREGMRVSMTMVGLKTITMMAATVILMVMRMWQWLCRSSGHCGMWPAEAAQQQQRGSLGPPDHMGEC